MRRFSQGNKSVLHLVFVANIVGDIIIVLDFLGEHGIILNMWLQTFRCDNKEVLMSFPKDERAVY